MTVEALLLLILFVFIVLGTFTKPGATFKEHSPKLGARIENHLTVGQDFKGPSGDLPQWQQPSGAPPSGSFQ